MTDVEKLSMSVFLSYLVVKSVVTPSEMSVVKNGLVLFSGTVTYTVGFAFLSGTVTSTVIFKASVETFAEVTFRLVILLTVVKFLLV